MSITKQNYEEWMVAFLDEELSNDEVQELKKFLDKNPTLKNELRAYSETKFTPDETILFDGKDALTPKSKNIPIKKIIWPLLIVGAMALAVFVYINKNSHNHTATAPEDSKIFSTNALEKQLFTVDNSKEQTLITEKGTIISIPKNAFRSDKNEIEIFVQEALNSEDILLANLHTQSDSASLSSGGMININVVEGENAALQEPIEIFVPKKTYNPKMNIYRGVRDACGNINWVDPKPVLGKKKSAAFMQGETIYKRNCTSCHSIFKDQTGPALYNVHQRRSKKWLHKFIKNSAKMIANNDPYAVCIYNQWNKTAQPSFENLSANEIDNVLFYIKEQSATRPDLSSQFPNPTSCDSCLTYKRRMDEIYKALPKELAKLNYGYSKKLEQENMAFQREGSRINMPNRVYSARGRKSRRTTLRYTTPPNRDYFYPIQATALGWYNIDMLLKQLGNNPVSIIASINNVGQSPQVSLLIPSLRVNVAGFPNGEGQYTFARGGVYSLNIPKGEKCFIICVAGKDDNRSLAIQDFKSEQENKISLTLEAMSKKEIIEEIKGLKLDQYELSPFASARLKEAEKQRIIYIENRKRRAAEQAAIKKKREAAYAQLKQKHKGNIEKISQAWQKGQADIQNKYHQEIMLAEHLKPLGCDCELNGESEEIPGSSLQATTAPAAAPVYDSSSGLNIINISESAILRAVDDINTGTGANESDYE